MPLRRCSSGAYPRTIRAQGNTAQQVLGSGLALTHFDVPAIQYPRSSSHVRPGLPGGKSLSLACPRESNQREGHPTAPVLRTALDLPLKPGGCGTRAARSDSPRRLLPALPTNRGGAEGESASRVSSVSRNGSADTGFLCKVLGSSGTGTRLIRF